jgi:hydrogenase nickel incorporation protein HypA/HybF
MHELPVTEEIMRIVLEHAREAKAHKVLQINLVIGDLTSFVSESIQFYFDFLSRDTEAAEAKLHIQRIPARARCYQCSAEFVPDGANWLCPECGALGGDVLSGREFYIESIEVE